MHGIEIMVNTKYKSERFRDFIDYRGSCGFSLSETNTFLM